MGTAIIGLDGRFQRINPALSRGLGYTEEELLQRSVLDIMPEEERQGCLSRARKMAAGELDDFVSEKRHIKQDGRIVWCRSFGRLVRDAAGKPHSILVMFEDIDQRKRQQEKIRNQQAFLEKVLAAIPHPFLVIDAEDYAIRYMNPAAARQQNGDGPETCHHLTHRSATPCDGTEHPCPMQIVKQTRQPTTVEHIHFDADGEPMTVEIHAYPVFDENGRIIQMIEYAEDVSERKVLINNLLLAMEEAEAANRAKTVFLGNIGHELKTPLNVIMGMVNLIQETARPTQQRPLEKVRAAASELLALINNLLDYTRIVDHKLTLRSEHFNLTRLLDKQAHKAETMAGEKGVAFDLHVGSDVPSVLTGDQDRLEQVLDILVGNAFKFCEAGEVSLSVQLLKIELDRATLFFSIKDTGIGIPPEKIPMLFEPFTQLDDSLGRRYGGVGLSLPLCKRLIKMMDGRIMVSSRPDCGSTFSFRVVLGCSGQTRVSGRQSVAQQAAVPQKLHGIESIDCRAACELLQTLQSFLEDDDTASQNRVPPLTKLLAGTVLQSSGDELERAVNGYDYAKALNILAELMNQLCRGTDEKGE